VAKERRQFGKPEVSERLPLETVIRRLMRTVNEDTRAVICKV
jgi:hypothetical protein